MYAGEWLTLSEGFGHLLLSGVCLVWIPDFGGGSEEEGIGCIKPLCPALKRLQLMGLWFQWDCCLAV